MKILMVSHSAGMLGAERSLLEIATAAVADGNVVVVSLPADGPLKQHLERAGCTCVVVPTYAWLGPRHWLPPVGALRLLQVARSGPAFCRLVSDVRPDVVVTNTSVTPGGARAARTLGVPHVWVVRESIGRNKQLRSLKSKRSIVDEIFRDSVTVCSVSSFVDRQVAQISPGPGRELHRVQPNPSRDITSEEAQHVPGPGVFRVLLPGYFSVEKGQHLAVLAMRAARSRGATTVRLTLVGRGGRAYTTLLRSLVRLLGLRSVVAIEPWTDDIAPHYARADATLFTSKNEAFGRVMAESLAYGVPVIAGDGGVAAEVLDAGGGAVVRPASPASYGEVLAAWSKESAGQRAARREAAHRRSRELSAMPTQYEQLLPALAAAAGSRPGRR